LVRRPRRGLTLIEVMVAMAILMAVVAVAIPSLQGVLDLQQRGSAKELAQTYTWLIDEAKLRNVTFRITFNLDRNTWKVEVGDPNTLVYSTPEERLAAEEAEKEKMARFTKRELEDGHGDAEVLTEDENRFVGLDDPAFTEGGELQGGAVFAYVYTPSYGPDGKRPSEKAPEEASEESVAYSHIFPAGSTEQTVIRIVDADDPEEGWTVSVEPLTGRVELSPDVIDPTEVLSWLPEQGPELR